MKILCLVIKLNIWSKFSVLNKLYVLLSYIQFYRGVRFNRISKNNGQGVLKKDKRNDITFRGRISLTNSLLNLLGKFTTKAIYWSIITTLLTWVCFHSLIADVSVSVTKILCTTSQGWCVSSSPEKVLFCKTSLLFSRSIRGCGTIMQRYFLCVSTSLN